MFRTSLTTVISLLGVALARTANTEMKQAVVESAPDFALDNMNAMCLATDPATAYTPVVDAAFIKNFIVSDISEKDKEKLANIINDLRSHPDFFYIDMVFTHLPGFKIVIYSMADIDEMAGGGFDALYIPLLKTFVCSKEALTNKEQLKVVVRHEIRHAVMHTMHMTLQSDLSTQVAQCYFPEVEEKHKEMAGYIGAGDKRIKQLEKSLAQEAKGTLKPAKQNELNALRKKIKKEYSANYKYTFEIENVDLDALNFLKQVARSESLEGKKVNLDSYEFLPSPKGELSIKKIERQKNGEVKIIFCMEDPLYAVVHYVNAHQNNMAAYPAKLHISERDAHLFGDMPISLIKHFYPELVAITQQNLERARTTPVEQVSFNHQPETFSAFNTRWLIETAADISLFVPQKTANFMVDVDFLITKKEIGKAMRVLNVIIEKGDKKYLPQARLKMAALQLQSNQFKNAVAHYKWVSKNHPGLFTTADHNNYGQALRQIGHLKTADKQDNIVRRMKS